MKKDAASGESAIDIIEEAVHLLRAAPLTLHAVYAIGTLPFILGFLYFWADMSRGAYAGEHADRSALGMALLFIWMKCWQVVYANNLRLRRTGWTPEPWTLKRIGWLALKQSALQPLGLFLMPVAMVVVLPIGWVCAFYQNLTAQGADAGGVRDAWSSAARQASYRPGQNHLLQGILALFSVFVWLNVFSAMASLPFLLKTILGIDTVFTRSGASSMFNTTYLACSFALTYVFADPLWKAVFVLRCFYGQSLQSGDDLKSELASIRSAASAAASILAAFVFFAVAAPASAATNSPPAKVAVSPAELNRSIEKVLQKPEFAWRMPREEVKEAPVKKSWLQRAIQSVVDLIVDAGKYCAHAIAEAFKWIWKKLSGLWPDSKSSTAESGWSGARWAYILQILLLILIVIIAGVLGVLIVRVWKQRRRIDTVIATPIAATPDLNDESVAADQLPEEGWLKLARELMAQGNLRLALRAFYLASLANLAGRELIAIASFKSNREYEMELRRRARALPAVQSAFSQNVAVFDRAWYGLHEVTQDVLQQFQANFEQIRA